jgi:hypothetical protein
MPNETRQTSYVFGPKEVCSACERLNLKLIVRAHQSFNRGFGFFAGKRLITVFSASRYNTAVFLFNTQGNTNNI